MSNLSVLFNSLKVGEVQIKNRIVMAAMTRMRCNPADSVPNDLLKEYYTQRADAGLILTECTKISSRSSAFPGCPGIYNDEQVQGWIKVTDSVHKKGGKICLQIWHSGRASHSKLQNGEQIWAPSPIAIRGPMRQAGEKTHEVPHEMTKNEIAEVLEQFRNGAINAKKAGFDNVELHGANGYLVDQFLKSSSNQRSDEYGGSIKNRSRFCLEAIEQLVSVFGPNKVGIKVSPITRYNDSYDENPVELYSHLLRELSLKQISFVEIANDNFPKNAFGFGYLGSREQVPNLFGALRPHFNGTIIGNSGLTAQQASTDIQNGLYDAVSFGIPFIANPDLVNRIKKEFPLANPDPKTFYGGDSKGYTDYPQHA